MVSSFRTEYEHNLFEIQQEKFIFSPTFIYLFKHLFKPLLTHGYVFYTLGYNPTHFYCSNCFSFGLGRSFGWLLYPFDVFPSVQRFFEHFFTFWCKMLQAYLAYFFAPVLESDISPRSSLPFIGELYFKPRSRL